MRAAASSEMQSIQTGVSSPLRCAIPLSPVIVGQKRATPDDSGDSKSQETTAIDTPPLKKNRLLDTPSPSRLQRLLAPADTARSALSEASNLFDQTEVVTQELLQDDNRTQNDANRSDDEGIALPLDRFGWPSAAGRDSAAISQPFVLDIDDDDFGNDNDDEENDLASFVSARRSILNELQSSEINHPDEDDQEDGLLVQESRRGLYEAVLGQDANDNDDSTRGDFLHEKSWLHEPSIQPSGPQHYDDDIDVFFSSSHVEDNITTERITSPQLVKRLLNWQQIRPGYLSSKPRFLTREYFETNGPKSCMDEEEHKQSNNQEHSAADTESYLDANFVLMDRLGSGEFADVYKARRHGSDMLLAVKRTKLPFCGYDDRWQQIVEVNHMNAVKGSPHCVELLSAWDQEGFLYMEMELCRNGSLRSFIDTNGEVPEQTVWAIIGEIAEGLKAIHDANIIHLDLKPSNILIDGAGRIKIGDFGVSVRAPVDPRWVKGEGDRRYMAPELLRDIFHKPADIFSLGMIMVELATQIELPDTGELWEQSRLGDFSGWAEYLARASGELQSFIRWLLTTDWQKRPTVHEILEHDQLIEAKATRCESQGILHDYIRPDNDSQAEDSPYRNIYCTPTHDKTPLSLKY